MSDATLVPAQQLQSDAPVNAWVTSAHVAVLELNAPDKLNALTVEMGEAFSAAVDKVAAQKDVRAVVLTGAGRAFSAGGDLSFLLARANDRPDNNADEMRAFYARFLSMRKLSAPIIAAVNGHAIGAGMCLALAADMRVVAEEAKLGVTFVGLGLHPGMGATHFLPKIVGPERAARWLCSGAVFPGAEASKWGIASDVVPAVDVRQTAEALALTIAKQSPVAVRSVTGTLRRADDADLARALAREADAQAQSYATADLREGIAALQEKRAPDFSGE